ncbi:PIN domain-containing protein [Collybia nuda]|uniref:PIN domain-containing protein n=1 Tax=Collybia nuda TaxID=64659 RepID=A0A9P5Y6X4_9AGAR|nr:PIN domain-containing protein [Collybia nuda]
MHPSLQSRPSGCSMRQSRFLAPLSESSTFLVLDTNILLHHFDVLAQFIEDAEKLSLPVIVVVPGAVIYELDGQKNRDGLAWFARRASAWLLKKVRERKYVRGQANEETCKSSKNWKIRVIGEDFGSERLNDTLILDCCLYFRRDRRTFLCSADINLCLESESERGIATITPSRNWSSREIAWVMFRDHGIDLSYFGSYRLSYKDPKSNMIALTPAAPQTDEDMMLVDEDASAPEILLPSHALDLLHIQVIDHFTRLLVELVGRVGGPEVHNRDRPSGGTSASRYAPQWQSLKRYYSEWTIADCLEFLESKRLIPTTSPRVDVFLSMPYTSPGARRGQDWSRRDWEIALGGLEKIGETWEEVSISESLGVLDSHVQGIFMMKMRPTGI